MVMERTGFPVRGRGRGSAQSGVIGRAPKALTDLYTRKPKDLAGVRIVLILLYLADAPIFLDALAGSCYDYCDDRSTKGYRECVRRGTERGLFEVVYDGSKPAIILTPLGREIASVDTAANRGHLGS